MQSTVRFKRTADARVLAHIRIGNVKRGDHGEYVGRTCYGKTGSPLANRFVVGVHGARGECCKIFGTWLDEQIEKSNAVVIGELLRLSHILRDHGSLTLVCWCAPNACHANEIARAIARIEET